MMLFPNVLTFMRLLSVPVTVWWMAEGQMAWAFWLFVAAGLTDAFDGGLARLLGAQSDLGAWLDPLADKALLVSVYLMLGLGGFLPLWLVVMVVSRDVVIVLYAGRTMLAGRFQGSPILISKVNTAVQIALAAFVLANLAFGWENGRGVEALIYAAAATTAASAAGYLFRAGDLS